MRVGPDAAAVTLAQVRPTEGQIRDLIAMLESGQDCGEVMALVTAISHALDRAWFRLLSTQLQHCLATSPSSDERGRNLQQLQDLFCSMS